MIINSHVSDNLKKPYKDYYLLPYEINVKHLMTKAYTSFIHSFINYSVSDESDKTYLRLPRTIQIPLNKLCR